MAKTSIFVLTAAILVVLAIWLKPGGVSDALYDDQGAEFFPAFKDIATVKELEIRTMDRLTGAVRVLEMQRGDKGWVISSHNDYPADMLRSTERLASFIGRTKDVVAGETPGSHGGFGVLDPQDSKSAGKEGVGRRYTFKGAGRQLLADFIVGKPVPKREGYCYVRVPGRDRVYETAMDLKLTYGGANNWLDTDFTDWVDIDPLKFSQQQITKITLNRYDIQEQKQFFSESVNIAGREVIEILKKMEGEPAKPFYTLADLDPNTEEPNKEALEAIATAIDTFTVEGATRKPDDLKAWLEERKVPFLPVKATEVEPLKGGGNQPGQRLVWVPSYNGGMTGFLMEESGPRLLSNLGEIIMDLDSGLRYVLRIGELSSVLGAEGAAAGDAAGGGDQPGAAVPASGKVNRYVMVDIDWDDSLMPEPMPPVKPQILVEEEERKAREEEERKAREDADKKARESAVPEEQPATPGTPTTPEDPAKPTEQDQETPAPETPAPETPAPAAPDAPVPADEDPAAKAAAEAEKTAAEAAKKLREEEIRKATNDYSQALSKYTSSRDDWTRKKTENTKRMNELKERYKDWIFMFPEELVAKTLKPRSELVKKKG
jgi:hypothetical protein